MSMISDASGIYRITCVPTGKIYIGSAIHLKSRWRVHRHGLRHSTHHSITLQRAWDKYGEDAFTFEVIDLVLVPFLIEREQYWLDMLQPFGIHGFNISRVAGSVLGHEVSPETREILRQANLGKKHTEEAKRKLSESGTGRTHSPETKERVRLIRLGTKRSPESRERSRISHLGKTHRPETIEKMSAIRMGHTTSEATRTKISEAQKGRPKDPESRADQMRTLIVIAPDGSEQVITGVKRFCREHDLHQSALMKVAEGKQSSHKGWKARFP